MEIKCKAGDSIGGIYKKDNGKWYLYEGKITSVRIGKNRAKIYSRGYYPLDYEDVMSNNDILLNGKNIMLVREVLWLTDEVRARVEAWIEWANANPDKAVSILTGE